MFESLPSPAFAFLRPSDPERCPSEWVDPEDEYRYMCGLPANHDGPHIQPTFWTDSQAVRP